MSNTAPGSRALRVLNAYNDNPNRGRAWAVFYARDAGGIPFRFMRNLLIVFDDHSSLILRDNDDCLLMGCDVTVEQAAAECERSIFF